MFWSLCPLTKKKMRPLVTLSSSLRMNHSLMPLRKKAKILRRDSACEACLSLFDTLESEMFIYLKVKMY